MLDSCILIENFKGTRTEILSALWDKPRIRLCISETVVSEFVFHFLALSSGKAPLTMKVNQEIALLLQHHNPEAFLRYFTLLPADAQVASSALSLMKSYNLLPNDALILAVCKAHHISYLATFDPDLLTACQNESITTVSNSADLEQFFNSIIV
ncbi:MAG: PIN domain-containing protein [Candidatus Kapabacteria bacterium]|nr:PIN domain-containing protein [Candidatus Kapabacteria bacterium]